MSTQTTCSCVTVGVRFHSAEQLWFWFLYSRGARTMRQCGREYESKRVCELLDVETLITKLYLSGQLSAEQLEIMKQFGDKRRAPHQHIWSENRAAALWRNAMATIESNAVKRGWIE